MKQQDFDRLKAICEKEGYQFAITSTDTGNDKVLVLIEKKDIWEGVEYVEVIEDSDNVSKGNIYKVLKVDKHLLGYLPNYYKVSENIHVSEEILKPSSEQAYIDQLKREAFDKWGGTLDSGRIDDSNLSGGRLEFWFDTNKDNPFKYRKDTDTLYWVGIPVYQSGKWAKLKAKRIEVKPYYHTFSGKEKELDFGFNLSEPMEKDLRKTAQFLASQLEKYLNNEI